jgi:prepilin-type N-terminal cleavage/methylation domain-containing protein
MHRTATALRLRRACLRAGQEDGFTLAELLIAMAILTVVLTSLTSLLVRASRNELDANRRFRAQAQARAGLDQLRRELHCASAVTTTGPATLNAGTAYSTITATLASTCPTTGGTALYATWLTCPSTVVTGDYALYRATSTTTTQPTCSSSGKVKWADYLTTPLGNVFCIPGSAVGTDCSGVLRPATASLPMLHVTMPVNVNGPSSTIDGYNIVDDIALRNGIRS